MENPMTDEWAYWRAMLKWRADPDAKFPQPDFDPKHPETGYYRGQHGEAVAIWWEGPTSIQCIVYTKQSWRSMTRSDEVGDQVFAYCCRRAITEDAYNAFVETRRWPEDIDPPDTMPPSLPSLSSPANGLIDQIRQNEAGTDGESGTPKIGDNLPKALDRALAAELDDLIERAAAWLKEAGTVDSKEKADKLANYGVAIAEVGKRADAAREAEKKPYLETGKAIDEKWRAVLYRAESAKSRLKALLLPWLSEQRRKAQEEAAAAEAERHKQEAARKAAVQAGMTPPPPPPLPSAVVSKSVAGTTGSVSIRSRTVYDVSNLKEASAYLAALDNPPPDFVEAVRKAGGALTKAGVAVPGIATRTVDAVA